MSALYDRDILLWSEQQADLLHLLLARYARVEPPSGHWLAEALGALDEASRRYAPSMAQRLDLPRAWRLACRQAEAKLAIDGGPSAPLPAECPYALADLIAPNTQPGPLLARLPLG